VHRRHDADRLPIADEVELTHAVAHVGHLAGKIGFDGVDAAKLMTAMSELARNVLKYAGTGTVRIAPVEQPGRRGIEIVVEDNGPGMASVSQALQDHFSTSGTLGLGLPGVRRMMDDFEVVSAPGRGTTVTIRKWL
jgi:serine/threonine-protein kinase RsbT